MNDSDLSKLFFIDSQGNENYGLALVPGKYQAQPRVKGQKAYLIIFMCINSDSIFTFYFVNSAGEYIAHSSLHPGEILIDYVLLEAWYMFDILPHYWILAEESEYYLTASKYPQAEYLKTYLRLKEVLSRFRWAEISKIGRNEKLRVLNKQNSQKYELNQLFHPDVPQEILTPLTL